MKSYEEYLQNEIIEDVEYIINDEEIRIHGGVTSFVYLEKPTLEYSATNILSLYNEVKQLQKSDKRVKLKDKTKRIKNINSIFEKYVRNTIEQISGFYEIKKLCEQLESRKIRYGCSNDLLLKEIHKMEKKYGFAIGCDKTIDYGNTSYSLYELQSQLEVALKKFEDERLISATIII